MALLTWLRANAAPLTRIGLRYAAAYGIFEGAARDDQTVMMISGLLVALVESAWVIAQRKGWAT